MHERINHTDGPPSRKSIKTTEEEKTAVAELFSIMDHFVDVFLLIDHVQNVIEPDSFHRAKREKSFFPFSCYSRLNLTSHFFIQNYVNIT
jgi:hypothetical protein